MLTSVLRRLGLGVVLAGLLLIAWTGVVLVQAGQDLTAARDTLERVRAEPGRDGTDRQLAAAERRLSRAAGRLSAPGPALTAELPVVGRTPEAIRRSAEAGLLSVRAARSLLAAGDASPLLQDGVLDLARLAELEQLSGSWARRLRPAVTRVERLELGFVPAVVTDGVRAARGDLRQVPDDLDRAAAGLGALRGVAGGDAKRLLLVVQNNAELRGTGGLVSVFADVTLVRGRLQLGAFRDVEAVADGPDTARPVPAPPDYAAVFGPLLANTTLWRNTNADPDVPRSSEVLAAVAGATTGATPDGVVWLDVPALAAVLGATSPAVLPDGTELTADNAVEVLLSDAYASVADEREAQSLRRARLRAAGDAVASRLLGGAPDLARLAGALTDAARRRHLAVWSSDAREQAGWVDAGLAGEVAAEGGDLAAVTVHNLGSGPEGNKLDLYARRSVRQSVRLEDGVAVVERQVELRNEAPAQGLPAYVAGVVNPGTTNNLVLHSLPPGAQDVVLERGGAALDVRPQPLGDSMVVQDVVSLPSGTAASWRLTYRLPLDGRPYALRVVPQPLAIDASLEVVVKAADGRQLALPPGSPATREGDRLVVRGQLGPQVELVVESDAGGLLRRAVDAVRRFWSEPVPVPW